MSDSPVVNEYDYRNCQSLFGYAAAVHERSGGICQLCGAGSSGIDFDLWRQMTVEHLIGESQGGYLGQISTALAQRFPGLSPTALAALAGRIDAANTITACFFCNSMTSRNQAPIAMTEAIQRAPDGSPEDIYGHVVADLEAVLVTKKREVSWKLAAVRKAFDSLVASRLADARATLGVASSHGGAITADVALLVERIISEVAPEPAEFVNPPGYAHISLALVDAVYSIRLRYSGVRRVVAAYCQASGTLDQRLAARSEPGFRERGLDHLLDLAGASTDQELADRVFGGSRSRTHGRLKADVCVEAAQRLRAAGVTCSGDLRNRASEAEVRQAWTGIYGLGWITWQYFCALTSIDELKPDVMLTRFVAKTLGRRVGAVETDELLVRVWEALLPRHPELTKRALDHTIWRFESGRS
jgi:hypothetical protein